MIVRKSEVGQERMDVRGNESAAGRPVARKCNLLGVGISATTYEQTCEAVRQAALARQSLTITALAVHGVMTGVLDASHRGRLNAIDVVVPDGQPVKWGINLLSDLRLRDRVRGPTLMLRLCEMAVRNDLSVAFYGNSKQALEQLRLNLLARFPNLRLALMMPSKFRQVSPEEQQNVARAIVDSGADLVFVGLGCPRQEVWLFENARLIDIPMIAVGAAFDFHAKLQPEAPLWLQENGLEWTYRLAREPRRLWRRYVLLNPLFLSLLLLQMLRLRSFTSKAPEGVIQHVGYA